MSTEYWWCWVGLAVNVAYIFFLNALIMLFLAFLPSYGSSSTVAKTAEELDDRRAALFGDEGRDANDVVVNMHIGYENGAVEHSNGAVTEMIQVTWFDSIAGAASCEGPLFIVLPNCGCFACLKGMKTLHLYDASSMGRPLRISFYVLGQEV